MGLDSLPEELRTVRAFTDYLLSCLNDREREQMTMIVERHELALNDTGRIGILFPDWLVDFRAGRGPAESVSQASDTPPDQS